MTIITALKNIVGYTGTDLDKIFAIISVIIVIFFIFTLFNILTSLFK